MTQFVSKLKNGYLQTLRADRLCSEINSLLQTRLKKSREKVPMEKDLDDLQIAGANLHQREEEAKSGARPDKLFFGALDNQGGSEEDLLLKYAQDYGVIMVMRQNKDKHN